MTEATSALPDAARILLTGASGYVGGRLLRALEANLKVSKFGIRELERIIFDFFAESFVAMRDKKIKAVSFSIDNNGKIVCSPAASKPQSAQGGAQAAV